MKFALLIIAFLLTLVGCRCESQPQQALGRVVALCESVRAEGSESLSEGQLDELREDLPKLSLFNLFEALSHLDRPENEPFMVPTSRLGEALPMNETGAWEEPLRVIVHEIISRKTAPRALAQTFLYSKPNFRGNLLFLTQLGEFHPELAWSFIQEGQRAVEIWGGRDYGYYSIGGGACFAGMERREDKIGRRLILSEIPKVQWSADNIKNDAYSGIVHSLKSVEKFEDFLNWRLEVGRFFYLCHWRWAGEDWMSNPNVSAESQALRGFARLNPAAASAWVLQNREALDALQFKWQYPMLNGWNEFYPDTPEKIPADKSRKEDALEWLADNTSDSPGLIEDVIDKILEAGSWR